MTPMRPDIVERLAEALGGTLCHTCQVALDGYCGGAGGVRECGSYYPVENRHGSLDPRTGLTEDEAFDGLEVA